MAMPGCPVLAKAQPPSPFRLWKVPRGLFPLLLLTWPVAGSCLNETLLLYLHRRDYTAVTWGLAYGGVKCPCVCVELFVIQRNFISWLCQQAGREAQSVGLHLSSLGARWAKLQRCSQPEAMQCFFCRAPRPARWPHVPHKGINSRMSNWPWATESTGTGDKAHGSWGAP